MTEQEMHEVIIALGTNTDHKPNMDKAVCMLGDHSDRHDVRYVHEHDCFGQLRP